jgi:putative aldouronate transport system permease protein
MNARTLTQTPGTYAPKRLQTNWGLLSMMAPGTIILFLFSLLPMFFILIAFQEIYFADEYLKAPFHTSLFQNFEFAFSNPYAFNMTFNTIGYNLLFIVIGTLAALAAAFGLEGLKAKRATRFYQTLLFLPYFLSWTVVSTLLFAILSVDQGVLNRQVIPALATFIPGMSAEPINWYITLEAWPFILVFANLWKYVGYTSIIYLAAMTSIDPGYIEAASLEGASRGQISRKIILPLISGVIIILVLLSIGKIFNSELGLFYFLPKNMGVLFPVTQTIDTYVFRSFQNNADIGASAAISLYQQAVGFILILTANLVVRKIDPELSMF